MGAARPVGEVVRQLDDRPAAEVFVGDVDNVVAKDGLDLVWGRAGGELKRARTTGCMAMGNEDLRNYHSEGCVRTKP